MTATRKPLPDCSKFPRCPACHALAGEPCTNYKGQRKFTCKARTDATVLVTGSLFAEEEARLRRLYVTPSMFDAVESPEPVARTVQARKPVTWEDMADRGH